MSIFSRRLRAVVTAAAVLLGIGVLAPIPAGADTDDPPPLQIEPVGQLALAGNLNLHDPTLWKDGDTYYAAASHRGIWSAPALEGPWTNIGSVPTASWAGNAVWAPHVKQIDGTTYYYYSTSSFGTNNSAIGLKTTTTPGDPASYVDHGSPIVTSGALSEDNNTFNAIDASIEQDDDGTWWMVWGSHFDGIFTQALADDMVTLVGEPIKVADRANERFPIDNPNFNRIEGPSVFKHGDWFYLLTAWDWCCRASGDDNTYKIVAGRSKNIQGPFLDKNGVDLAEGGGTIILNSRIAQEGITPQGLYRSPGAPDYFWEDGTLYLTYHAHRPGTVMGIRPFNWDDGWPFFHEPGGGAYDITPGSVYQLRLQAGTLSDPDSLQNPVASTNCLSTHEEGAALTECDEDMDQYFTLERKGDGFYSWRSLSGDYDQCLALTSLSGDVGTPVATDKCDSSDAQLWYFDDTGHGFHRLVGKTSNLALEAESDDNGTLVSSNIIGGFRRDGDHQAGNLTQAAKWPPQQWRLEMQPAITPPPIPSPTPTPDPSPTQAPDPTPAPTPSPTPPALVDDLYAVPGYHEVNGRRWYTTCEPYSQTKRCTTQIWASQITLENGAFVQRTGWTFNNLTYLPSARSLWKGNPLGTTGSWTSSEGRRWMTECDTPATGRNGCRSFLWTTYYAVITEPGVPTRIQQENGWVLNNIVRFS